MSLWEKIAKDLQQSATTLSELAGDWIKSSTEALREGLETASEKTAQATKLAKLKWEKNLIHRDLEKAFLALGGQVYELHVQGRLPELATAAHDQLAALRDLEEKLESKEKEIAELQNAPAAGARQQDTTDSAQT
ncbi:MAG: hypothetical protein ONB48_05365 [candidate division KSB1 bacterium]|nr:hypothetical protein [candidate division KSB1 bacterium]MDZ7272975.1 hypothetical protein [candidate division KSB1 bacterium]MDZ7285079.1 hypothetical protein [candidate division KSB1 bacterium]MDZ7298111.1 hypothetical protein [candidate division KSB1 bacterium]MDZ7349256.1 hypothetical protein [candidate division KSB1 bacterium]